MDMSFQSYSLARKDKIGHNNSKPKTLCLEKTFAIIPENCWEEWHHARDTENSLLQI